MSTSHPHAHPRAHQPHAQHLQQMHPDARRGHHPQHHSAGFRSRIGRTFARVIRLLFRTRAGRVSRTKIVAFGVVTLATLYVLLVRGLLPFDVASPWIARALEEQLGKGYKVKIGHTVVDHDALGAPVLRVNGIRVRGPSGRVIATAPSAVVGLDGSSMLVGGFRARRIDLVGAETTVRIGADGRVAITAGRDASPLTPDAEASAAAAATKKPPAKKDTARLPTEHFYYPELVRWLDSLERSGLDGVALAEIGLKQGTLIVESATTGRKWVFHNINIQLVRPAEGGLLFTISSSGAEKSWNLTATVGAVQDGARAIDIVASDLLPGDLLLAAGLSDINFLAETPLSGILRAQIHEDGRLASAVMRVLGGSGIIGSTTDPEARFKVDETQVQVLYDPNRRAMIVDPILLRVGANRFALSAIVEAPKGEETTWPVSIAQGMLSLSTGRDGETPLVLNHLNVRAVYDPALHRLIIQQGDLSGATTGAAFSGSLSFGPTPTLALGIACTKMPVSAAKKLWPALVAVGTRGWAMDRIEGGVIERVLIALNVPLDAIGKPDVELPDPAVRFEMTATGAVFRPTANLPLMRDAQVTAVVTGRTARVRIAKAIVDTPGGRTIAISDGVLEVPNHAPPNPNGTIQFRFDGPADAIAEMIATDTLKDAAGYTIDPATTKGSVSASLRLDLVFRRNVREGEVDYLAEGDVTGFSADRIVRGQRVDGVNAKVSVTPAAVQIKGEGKIAGAAANFEYRKSRTKVKSDAEFRITTSLDDNARMRFGIELAPWLVGPVGVRAQGRINERETRVDVENDLTAAKVSDLVPGWQKPAGRSAKANYRMIERDNSVKLEDLTITGSGTTLKGSLEIDGEGGLVSSNFPVFQLSDGDKATLRAERAADGTLKVAVRGDVLDARGVIRGMTEGPGQGSQAHPYRVRDLDLDLRLGAATGNNGEVARQLEMRLLRRNGEIRSFSLLGKIGRDASLVGELRAREGGRPVLYMTASDAGALFRFADIYNRIQGGEVWIVIDPPNQSGAPQEGIINVRNFAIHGEPSFERMQSAAPPDPTDVRAATRPATVGSVPFIRAQIAFNRTPGKFNIREGLVFGPTVGATVEGALDYANNQVHIRGTYSPAFGINNLLGSVPVLGFVFGGPKEGLLAITFEIVGPVSGPTLRVNPMSAAAPGLFRKFFEFRGASDTPPAIPLNR